MYFNSNHVSLFFSWYLLNASKASNTILNVSYELPNLILQRPYVGTIVFADEKIEVQQWSNLLKITQLIGGKAGMQTQVVWLQSLHS